MDQWHRKSEQLSAREQRGRAVTMLSRDPETRKSETVCGPSTFKTDSIAHQPNINNFFAVAVG